MVMLFNSRCEVSHLYTVLKNFNCLAMRRHWISSLLLTTCCLAGLPGLAQRAAVAPIAPRVVPVLPIAPAYQGVAVDPTAASRSASPSEPNTMHYQPVLQPDPLYILNSQVIIGNGLRNIMPNDIEKLYVYKGGPDTPWKWRSLTNYGIIDITLKDKRQTWLETKTLAQIGKGLQLKGSVSYFINGMPVGESDLRIATAAIGEVKVTRATPTVPTTQVNIQLARYTPPPLAPDPSGKPRIMIRGTASL
jgi:hypothetical protein